LGKGEVYFFSGETCFEGRGGGRGGGRKRGSGGAYTEVVGALDQGVGKGTNRPEKKTISFEPFKRPRHTRGEREKKSVPHPPQTHGRSKKTKRVLRKENS